MQCKQRNASMHCAQRMSHAHSCIRRCITIATEGVGLPATPVGSWVLLNLLFLSSCVKQQNRRTAASHRESRCRQSCDTYPVPTDIQLPVTPNNRNCCAHHGVIAWTSSCDKPCEQHQQDPAGPASAVQAMLCSSLDAMTRCNDGVLGLLLELNDQAQLAQPGVDSCCWTAGCWS